MVNLFSSTMLGCFKLYRYTETGTLVAFCNVGGIVNCSIKRAGVVYNGRCAAKSNKYIGALIEALEAMNCDIKISGTNSYLVVMDSLGNGEYEEIL